MTSQHISTDSRLLFDPPCGPIEGWADGAVFRATGIPYARAGRFEPAEPEPDWRSPFPAKRPAPACPQRPVPFLDEALGTTLVDLPQDEDCLRLSVTLPADVAAGEALPVMVWIHGGSYASGAGDAPIYDPASLVAEQRVVVVTVTYRLGLFGYLGDGAGKAANLGLLDQIAALHWVKRNIGAFRGDASNVTAFGQSAGGDAVAHMMATEGVESLFERAIIQSPPLGIARGRRAMNAAMSRASETVTSDTEVSTVLETEAAVAGAASRFGLRGFMPFGTQYGHAPLPAEEDVETSWDRAAPHVDLLIGHTAQEGRLFLPRVPALQRWLRLPLIGPLLRKVVGGYITEAVYGHAIRRFARRHVKAGGRAHVYTIIWAAPGNVFGSAHTIELPLLFGSSRVWEHAEIVAGAHWRDIDASGKQLRKLWADFARGKSATMEMAVPGVMKLHRVA